MYMFYLGNTLLPVAPGELKIKVKNQNRTVELINSQEVSVLKKPGLTDIEFKALLPGTNYPFAVYKNGFQKPDVYLEKLERIKTKKHPFQFIVTREAADSFDTNIKVSLEEYEIVENAKNVFDVEVSIKLKQYVPAGVKICKIKKNKIRKKRVRTEGKSPEPKSKAKKYKVKKGDCLWNIAKKYYGDGKLWKKLNNGNPKIYPGQSITIPVLKG